MKTLFLLMALILTLTQFGAIAYGAESTQPTADMAIQHTDCPSLG